MVRLCGRHLRGAVSVLRKPFHPRVSQEQQEQQPVGSKNSRFANRQLQQPVGGDLQLGHISPHLVQIVFQEYLPSRLQGTGILAERNFFGCRAGRRHHLDDCGICQPFPLRPADGGALPYPASQRQLPNRVLPESGDKPQPAAPVYRNQPRHSDIRPPHPTCRSTHPGFDFRCPKAQRQRIRPARGHVRQAMGRRLGKRTYLRRTSADGSPHRIPTEDGVRSRHPVQPSIATAHQRTDGIHSHHQWSEPAGADQYRKHQDPFCLSSEPCIARHVHVHQLSGEY